MVQKGGMTGTEAELALKVRFSTPIVHLETPDNTRAKTWLLTAETGHRLSRQERDLILPVWDKLQ